MYPREFTDLLPDYRKKEMATHSSMLAWKTPWTEEPGGLQSIGSQRAGHKRTAKDSIAQQEDIFHMISVETVVNMSPHFTNPTLSLFLWIPHTQNPHQQAQKLYSSLISSFSGSIFVDSHPEPKHFQGTSNAVVNRAERTLAFTWSLWCSWKR